MIPVQRHRTIRAGLHIRTGAGCFSHDPRGRIVTTEARSQAVVGLLARWESEFRTIAAHRHFSDVEQIASAPQDSGIIARAILKATPAARRASGTGNRCPLCLDGTMAIQSPWSFPAHSAHWPRLAARLKFQSDLPFPCRRSRQTWRWRTKIAPWNPCFHNRRGQSAQTFP